MRPKVTGDKELAQALRTLGKGLPGAMIDGAMADASSPMLADAVSRARKHRQPGRRPRGGHLDEGIVFRKRTRQTARRRNYVIGAINRARRILHLLELGVRIHAQPNRFGGIIHPGHRPFPIMRPALDTHADDIQIRFARNIWQHIRVLVATLPKGPRVRR